MFEVFSDKLKSQQDKMILSLQYCKPTRKQTKMQNNGWATSEQKLGNVVINIDRTLKEQS